MEKKTRGREGGRKEGGKGEGKKIPVGNAHRGKPKAKREWKRGKKKPSQQRDSCGRGLVACADEMMTMISI